MQARSAAGSTLAYRVGFSRVSKDLQLLAVGGSASVRAGAVRALGRTGGVAHRDEVVAFCEANCVEDRSSAVRQAVAEIIDTESQSGPVVGAELPEPDLTGPDKIVEAKYVRLFEHAHEADLREYKHRARWHKMQASMASNRVTALGPSPQKLSNQDIDAGWRYICDGGRVPTGLAGQWNVQRFADAVTDQCGPLHTFRLLALLGSSPSLSRSVPFPKFLASYRETGHPTPIEIQAAAEFVGFSRKEILAAFPKELSWSDEDILPWVAAALRDFMDVIVAGETGFRDSIEKYYSAVAVFPKLPSDLRRLLLEQSISGRKANQPLARAALINDKNLIPSVVEYLASGKYSERAEAALWLASLGCVEAITPLHKAAAKEKHDHAKAAILTALERLDEPIDRHLDRHVLLVEAQKGLTRKLPSAAGWIPLESLPPLHWKDGTLVDAAIGRWLVVQAVRLKSPAPSPMVRRFFDQMSLQDVESFANTILSMWLEEDIRPASVEVATRLAHESVQSVRNGLRYYPDANLLTDEQLFAHCLDEHLEWPAASAVGSKGMLSLTAAGGGLAVVAPAEAFLRSWYGMRSSQCKSLIEMLAWVEDPSAIQLVLSVGTRFRTKGIRQEAVLQAELLAERKGWTLEDLAYRTIPTGGFDRDGTLILSYGERRFIARVADDLSLIISTDEGKTLKAMPAQRKGDDEALVNAAKKEFSTAKRQVRAAAKQQPLRLHEAMCVERSFEVDDFRRYVLGHPLMSRLATRLVWVADNAGGQNTLFRPLSDGTLLDENDDDVSLDESVAVRIAHGTLDGDAVGSAWSQHFIDYAVVSLFPQFDRPQAPAFGPEQASLAECQGAIIDDRRLRSVVAKIGYELGPAEDAGFVHVVKRRFPSAGLEARIVVRGLHAAIMKQDVALEHLEFGPLDGYETVALVTVPAVLLAEAVAEVDQVVAAGGGLLRIGRRGQPGHETARVGVLMYLDRDGPPLPASGR